MGVGHQFELPGTWEGIRALLHEADATADQQRRLDIGASISHYAAKAPSAPAPEWSHCPRDSLRAPPASR